MGDAGRLDGNVAGGMMIELFGSEMTGRRGCCGGCGTINPLGAMSVYMDAPGEVMRCPSCDSVLMVMTPIDRVVRVNLAALAWVEIAAG